MEKDKVLPLVPPPRDGGYNTWVAAQRDADLIILERDYVARERVKPLVKFLESFRRNQDLVKRDIRERQGYCFAFEALIVKAEDVLKALEEKP